MSKEKSKEEIERMIQGVGITAEMSLIFYRAALEAEATPEEAIKLTQAYLVALLFGNQQNQKPPESEEG